MNDRQFIQYLSNTLIPDLRESGMNATADDFRRCVDIMLFRDCRIESLVNQCNDFIIKRGIK